MNTHICFTIKFIILNDLFKQLDVKNYTQKITNINNNFIWFFFQMKIFTIKTEIEWKTTKLRNTSS